VDHVFARIPSVHRCVLGSPTVSAGTGDHHSSVNSVCDFFFTLCMYGAVMHTPQRRPCRPRKMANQHPPQAGCFFTFSGSPLICADESTSTDNAPPVPLARARHPHRRLDETGWSLLPVAITGPVPAYHQVDLRVRRKKRLTLKEAPLASPGLARWRWLLRRMRSSARLRNPALSVIITHHPSLNLSSTVLRLPVFITFLVWSQHELEDPVSPCDHVRTRVRHRRLFQ
jgi:hypothetical protein